MHLPCDQCYTRRVKCRGQQEACDECLRIKLQCTRLRVRKKRGPKPSTRLQTSHSPKTTSVPPPTADDLDQIPDATTSAGYSQTEELSRSIDAPLYQRNGNSTAIFSRVSDFTVNELANGILEYDDASDLRQHILSVTRIRRSSSSSPWPALHNSPNLVRPIIWGADASNVPQSPIAAQEFDNNHDSRNHYTNAGDTRCDPISLAIAVGLPQRYGSDILHCIDTYFSELHHVVCVVHEPSIRRLIQSPPEMSNFQRSFLLSLCAVVKLKSWCISDDPDASQKETACLYLERCLLLRSDIKFTEENCPLTVVASYMLHLAYGCLYKPRASRYYLQEGICHALDLGLHHRCPVRTVTDEIEVDSICAQRALALLFVTERATAILDDCSAVLLQEPPAIPEARFNDRDSATLNGFKCLFKLFALLDTDIMEYWCLGKVRFEEQRNVLQKKLIFMQEQLLDISFANEPLDYVQKADILVTQQWLRLICWQVAMRLGLLSSKSVAPAFSYDYPISISADLCEVLQALPEEALRAHHFSIYCKIFEVAYALMDVMTLAGRTPGIEGTAELRTLFRYLSTSPINNMRFARVLIEKERSHADGTNWTPSVHSNG